MGNIIRRDGRLYHETGPGQEEQIALDELGQPLVGIIHGTAVTAARDGGNVVLAYGGAAVSFPADVAAQIIDALAEHAPEAAAAEATSAIRREAGRLEEKRAEMLADLEGEIAAKRAELEQVKGERAADENPDLPLGI